MERVIPILRASARIFAPSPELSFVTTSISTAFLFKDSIIPPTYLVGRLLFPTVVTDSAALERIFQNSQLDWTLVRPPQLTDTSFTGKYRVRLGHLPRFGFKIARADVADYFIKAASDNTLVRKIVGVSN